MDYCTEKYKPLVEEKKKSNQGIAVLDLGSGSNSRKEWVSLDFTNEADINFNLEECGEGFELPFEDDVFDSINASHILEHIRGLDHLMNELHRILKEEGVLLIKVPNFPSAAAICDPSHVRFFHPDTILYYTPGWPFYKRPYVLKWELRKRVFNQQEITWVLTPLKKEVEDIPVELSKEIGKNELFEIGELVA